ncbi:MAG: Unknown protein [uncultured Sulfurovum sp.]|uniref:Endonuclease GajA/Old nuclease/RecF-like AAA domain-containing protein n=1 Tax=uncultured Sulfurovum sp. TaxID=269237 RepID=A0A6S6TIP6_9BACT|nr:MAG: Unknown protein [uncultured Sulfurovum sp.]
MEENNQEHFIKNIEIKNFKCFEDFKAEGFGRVNLIGGKNNVGKTAFMEATYVNTRVEDVKSFTSALTDVKDMRENLNILAELITNKFKEKERHIKSLELFNKLNIISNVNNISYNIEEIDSVKKYIFDIKDKTKTINVNDFSFIYSRKSNVNFIDNFGLSNIEIIHSYSFIQRKDEESYLNSLLKLLDSRIESFKIIDEIPQCKVNNKYCEITEFGDGVRHLISIVTSLYQSEDGYIYIDELDNGIHYTMLDELWTVVLLISQKLNVQVFATTHSKECIESFNRVQLKKLDETQDTYYFEMARNSKTDRIFMSKIDSEQLEYELSHQGRFRGE